MGELFYNPVLKTTSTKPIACLAIGTSLIAIGPFFVEFSGLAAIESSFYRVLIGGIAFLIIGLIRNEKLPNFRFAWLYMAAAIMIAIDLFLCNQSILYIGSGLATVLSNLEVIFLLMIGALFFKEKINRSFPITCLCICAGIYFLIQPNLSEMHKNLIVGVSCALFASFVFSLYLLILKSISNYTPNTSTATNLGVICFFATIIIGIVIAYTPQATFALPVSWSGIMCVVMYGLISQVAGWWLISEGLKQLNLSTSGVLFLLQPTITYLGDCIFLGRNTGTLQILGCFILLTMVYISIVNEEKRKSIA